MKNTKNINQLLKAYVFNFGTVNSYNALSPLDGRYFNNISNVSPYFSEAALMKYRIKVEA